MAHFDQRNQKVTNQTNIAGNQYNAGGNLIHVEGADSAAIVQELQALLKQLQEAAQSGDLDAETAVDAEYSLKKATIEAGKDQPDKSKCLEYFDKAKSILDKAVGVSKSAVELGAALTAVYAKLKGWL
jgi:uncharacterized membrane protein